jgi:hypothetical protein
MFDAGFKWIRIGQYENSSDRTSWDWIEQKRGVYSSSQELEDYVDSLLDNGVNTSAATVWQSHVHGRCWQDAGHRYSRTGFVS